MRKTMIALGALLLATPIVAQTSSGTTSSTTSQSGAQGNNVTTSTTSDPTMKTGSERSPTLGAPTNSGVGSGAAVGSGPNH